MLLKTPHLLQTFLGALGWGFQVRLPGTRPGVEPRLGAQPLAPGLSAWGPTVAGDFLLGPPTQLALGQAAALAASPMFLSLVG